MKKRENTQLQQPKNVREPIAIIGMGCRFPGEINDPGAFWDFLKSGGDAISEVPADRWNIESFYDPNPSKAGKIKSYKGGFLKDIDKFDAGFFGIFPNEAQRIDPQQRHLLEVAYEAFQDAGITLDTLSGSKTGVYMGVFMNDYWDIQASTQQRDQISPHVPMGVSLTAIANRLSYVYNLKGPSMTLDTACSSSLVCVHLACQGIWNNETELALAGGVNLIIRPESSIMMSKGNFLSPDGYCKSFDSRANGYVRSEGSGVIVLKPLSKALEDGDQIYALIRGSAVNQDGHTEEGFTVPSYTAQVDMLKTAYEAAGVSPSEVSYVEAHGTGTPVGDPIETRAFGEVIGKERQIENACVIGSVKSNIGHLEAAAGIAGIIKLALVLKNRQIPSNLHFLNPNPNIPFDEYKLRVPTKLENIDKKEAIFGGVNSFGAGGTNAHVVLEEYIPAEVVHAMPAETEDVETLILSAKSGDALKATASTYRQFLAETTASLKDICFSTLEKRTAFEYKLAVCGKSKEEIMNALDAFVIDETRPNMTSAKSERNSRTKIGFVFSGQGPQWYAMGQQLIKTSPVFRDTILQIEGHFKEIADWSLLEEMNKDEQSSRVSDTRIAQPAIMAIQVALTALWKSWGIVPQGCVGHSIGEVAAAYASGALTLEQAVEVIFHRSRGQNKATDKGKMLAVGLPLTAARAEILGLEEKISIAAINGPNMVALSGDADALEIVAERLNSRDIFHRYLKVNVPFHSHHMDELKEDLISSLIHLKPKKAEIPLYSTVTGKQESGEHLLSEYWFQNVREPVYFTDAIQSMIDDGFDTFIEVAPHPILSTGVNEMFEVNKIGNGLIIPSLRRGDNEAITMRQSLGMLWVNGYELSAKDLFANGAQFVKLPKYPWQSQSYWFETREHKENRLGKAGHPFLLSNKKSAANNAVDLWDVNLNPAIHLFLEDHKVDGAIVFPGTGHLEMAQAVGKEIAPEHFSHLEDVQFEAALFLPEEGESPEIRLEIGSDEGDYSICSRSKDSESEAWSYHSKGRISTMPTSFISKKIDLKAVRDRATETVSIPDFYLELKEGGLNYGESFRCVQKIWTNESEVLGTIKLPNTLEAESQRFLFHPALLDACLHTLFAARKSDNEEKKGIYLPVKINKFKIHGKPGLNVWTYIEVLEASDDFLKGNYWIYDENENLVAEIQGLECKYIEGSRGEQKNDLYKGMYAYQWSELAMEQAPQEEMVKNELCVIFADDAGHYTNLIPLIEKRGLEVFLVKKGKEFSNGIPGELKANPLYMDEIEEVLKRIESYGQQASKIVYLWGLDTGSGHDISAEMLQSTQKSLTISLLNTLKAIGGLDYEPSVFLISGGLEQVLENDRDVNVHQAAIYGFGRVMINEFPFVPMKMIDISNDSSLAEWNKLVEIIALPAQFKNPELAIRNQQVFERKLVPVAMEEAEEKCAFERKNNTMPFKTSVMEPGLMESIRFRKCARKKLQADEIEIQVRAAGVNFKDIMNVMGLLTQEAVEGGVAGAQLGLECAGVVSAVGENVTDIKVGDEVMAWAPECFAGYTVTKENCVVTKPQNLSFEEAATATVTFLTAYYALHYLGRLSKGEKVLIHSATGGVGLAAIQIAKFLGAEIFATAGNDEKRAYLKSLGIKYVYDSRSLDFSNEILKATQGKGIDMVLNSLSGQAIAQSMRCLAPFGRFMEIGKTDIYSNSRLGLKRFGQNISYHAIDLDRLMLQKPVLGQQLYKGVVDLLASGQIKASPVKTFPINQLADALSYLSKGIHIGKVCTTIHGEPLTIYPEESMSLSHDATYLVTGGASGFGIELARWLVDKGAMNLVLVSRSGCKTVYDNLLLKTLETKGVKVKMANIDITSFADVERVIEETKAEMPPLKGIIHSAAVLDDATLKNMSSEKFLRVYEPKVMGAWNLHLATKELELDFFLSLSSISSIFGLPGQSNYSSANNFLDKLAMYRQSKGLAGSSVNLGVLGMFAGMSKEGGQVLKVLENQGWFPLSLRQVTSKIENIIIQQPAYRMAANIDWKRFKEFFSHLQSDGRFEAIIQNETQGKGSQTNGAAGLYDQVMALPAPERQEFLQEKITVALAKILGASAEQLDPSVSVSKIGLDSLMLNQLRNWIQQKLEINFPLMKIAKGPSIFELAGLLLDEMGTTATQETTEVDSSGIGLNEDVEVVNQWLIRRKSSSGTVNQRVFCIHPVGAGASMFYHFIFNPPKDTEVMAFQLPGRENRLEEQNYDQVPLLIEDMAKAMQPFLDKPFIIMGHSFGGIVGYELTRYLQRTWQLKPIHFFLSGTIAPHLTKKWKDRDVISKTAVFSNSEDRLLALMNYIEDVAFLKRILPIMRKDMPLIMNYNYVEDEKLTIPITAFAGDKDEVVMPGEVNAWQEHTNTDFQLVMVPGDHWFLSRNKELVSEKLEEAIEKVFLVS